MDRQFLKNPISSREQGEQFLRDLVKAELSFHLEDSPETIINCRTKERIFSDEEAVVVTQRVNELYALDWSEFECPIGFLLYLEGHFMEVETESELCAELEKFCKATGLRLASADELLICDDLTGSQRQYLSAFLMQWEKVVG